MRLKKYEKFYGWKMLVVLWSVYCLMQGFVMYGEPVLNTFMIIQLDFPRTVLGIGSTILVLSQALAGPFVSKTITKWGIRICIIIGAIVVLISSILMGTVINTPLGYWICFGFLSGTGMAFAGMFSVQTGVNYWFRERRGFAIAIALTGSGVGGWTAGQLLNIILNSANDYMVGWHLISATCIITIIIAYLFIIDRPEDIGQIPDGKDYDLEHANSEKENRFSRVFKIIGNMHISEIVRDHRFWGAILGLAALRFGYNICVSQGIIHLLDVNVPTAVAATSIGSMTLFSTFGRLGTGFFVDKIEPRICWLAGMFVFLIGMVSLWMASASWMAYVFSGGIGIGFGISYVASSTLVSNYFGVDAFPRAMGIIFPVQHVAGAIAPLSAGIIYDVTGSYDYIFIAGIAFVIIGIVGITSANLPKSNIGSIKEYRERM